MHFSRIIIALMAFAAATAAQASDSQTATFAGGCFWCMDSEFSHVPGVSKVVSGYTGGETKNPTYEEVSSGTTGHFESIEITFDPAKVPYAKLLDIFWHNVDPTDETGQFCDKGSQYRAGIFYHTKDQAQLAESSRADMKKILGQEIAVVVAPATEFYPAEAYHQDYASKNAIHYKMYRMGCGRDDRLKRIWQDKPAAAQH